MGKCDLCGKKKVGVCDCLSCGSKFCDYCGDIDRNVCEECVSYEEDSIESEDDIEADSG